MGRDRKVLFCDREDKKRMMLSCVFLLLLCRFIGSRSSTIDMKRNSSKTLSHINGKSAVIRPITTSKNAKLSTHGQFRKIDANVFGLKESLDLKIQKCTLHHDKTISVNTMLNSTSRIELDMLNKEMDKSSKVFLYLKCLGYSIAGFYHTSAYQSHWKEVLTEQLSLLDGKRKIPIDIDSNNSFYAWDDKQRYTSLLNASDSLFLNIVGPDYSS